MPCETCLESPIFEKQRQVKAAEHGIPAALVKGLCGPRRNAVSLQHSQSALPSSQMKEG